MIDTTTKQQKKSTVSKLIASIVPDARHLVTWVESQHPTTQDHYGAYLSILGQVPNDPLRQILACALIDAGANKRGVRAACIALGLVQVRDLN